MGNICTTPCSTTELAVSVALPGPQRGCGLSADQENPKIGGKNTTTIAAQAP